MGPTHLQSAHGGCSREGPDTCSAILVLSLVPAFPICSFLMPRFSVSLTPPVHPAHLGMHPQGKCCAKFGASETKPWLSRSLASHCGTAR